MSDKVRKIIKRLFPGHQQTVGNITLRFAAIALLLGVIAMIIVSQPGPKRALVLATSHQAEPYTELYFNNPSQLPKEFPLDEPTTISFHIANHETISKTYHAHIKLVQNGHVQTLRSFVFNLDTNKSKDLSIPVVIYEPNQNLQLIIELPDQNLQINFRSQS